MAPTLNTSSKAHIKTLIDQSTLSGLPGISVIITNENGENLIDYSSGVTGNSDDEKLTSNHLFKIASCTKLVTSIALLQLLEKGKIDLDDPNVIQKYAKEITTLPIASLAENDSIILEDRTNDITLRQLLTHTSGLSYPFLNPVIKKFADDFSLFKAPTRSLQDHILPLSFEPGTKWEYGVSIDWVGIIIERVTGETLDDYFRKNIFEPLGVKDTTFLPSQEQFERVVNLFEKNSETGEYTRSKVSRKELYKGKTLQSIFQQGGCGLFSSPLEYSKILNTVLNNGVSPITGNRILKKETIDLIFTNQLPQWPNFTRGIFDVSTKPDPHDELDTKNPYYPQRNQLPQGFGLSLLLNLEEDIDTGRAKNSGTWSGSFNWYYWIDRQKGIAGLLAGQITPWGDQKIFDLWKEVETEVYKNLV